MIDGYASAGNMISGKLYGSKDIDNLLILTKKLTKYGLVVGFLLLLLLGIFYFPLGRLYSNNELVREQFYNTFWIALAMQPICAVAFIYDGIYKGMGKMKTLRNLLLITTFLGFIPVLLIANYFGLMLYGIWLAFVVWVFLRGLILKIDFKKSIENNTLFDD